MLTNGNHKPGSVKRGYYALKFLFTQTYHKEWAKEYLPTPKIAKTLPQVLSKDEVVGVLEVIRNFKHRTIETTPRSLKPLELEYLVSA